MEELQELIDFWQELYNTTEAHTSIHFQRMILRTIDKLQELKDLKER